VPRGRDWHTPPQPPTTHTPVTTTVTRRTLWLVRYCSPRPRMPSSPRNEGFRRVSMTWRAICGRPYRGGGRGDAGRGMAATGAAPAARAGRGDIKNKPSSDVESPPPPPHVCMSIHNQGKSCSDLGREPVLNDPASRPLWWTWPASTCTRRRQRTTPPWRRRRPSSGSSAGAYTRPPFSST